MINITKISLTNFMAYNGTHTIDIGGGLVNIRGKNGCGKSNIFMALEWVFCGATSGGVRAGQIINNKAKTASVEVTTNAGVLLRSQKPNKLTLDGEVVTQEHIYDVFGNSIGATISANTSNIVNSTPANRRDILDNMLSENRWPHAVEALRLSIKARLQNTRTTEDNVTRAETRLQMIIDETVVDTRPDRIGALRARISDRQTEHKQRIESAERAVHACDGINKARIADALHSYETELDRLNAFPKIASLPQIDTQPQDTAKELHARERACSIRTETALAQSIEDKKSMLSSSHCKLCGSELSSVTDNQIETLQKRIDALTFKASTVSKREEKAYARLCIENEAVQEHNNKVEEIRKSVVLYDALKASTEKAKTCLAKATNAPTGKELAQSALDSLRGTTPSINGFKQAIDKINAEQSPDDIKAQRVAEYQQKVENAKSEQQAAQSVYTNTVQAHKAMKEAALIPLRDICNGISRRVNAYLRDILEGWTIELIIEKETETTISRKIDCLVFNEYGDALPYRALSAGQKQRVALSAAFAMTDMLGSSINIEVYDEQLVNVDKAAKVEILEILKERAQRLGKCIYIVEHTATDFAYDTILTVTRTDNESSFSVSEL